MQPRLPSELFGTRRSIRNSRRLENESENPVVAGKFEVRHIGDHDGTIVRYNFLDNRFARTLGFFSQSLLVRLLQEIATQPMMRKSRFEEMNRMA
ncbi:hypothetical protein HanIR_Chr03g0118801 [Helianthus annuus]|nr:hypothetical protein HanIR_Chr03g0118801 [Helianthus annuus]